MGEMFADSQSTGSKPWSREDLYMCMCVKSGAISFAVSLRKNAGMLSGPSALLGFKLVSKLATPSTVTLTDEI